MKKIAAAFLLWLAASPSFANPYLPKPGERPLSMRVSTCAVSGGFVHLYTALDNGLFDKYGIRLENIFIRGSAQNLTALSTDEVQFTYCASDAIIPGMADATEVRIKVTMQLDQDGNIVGEPEVVASGGSEAARRALAGGARRAILKSGFREIALVTHTSRPWGERVRVRSLGDETAAYLAAALPR